MVASNPWDQPALNFFMNSVLICFTCSKIFELGHIFEGFIISLYVMILSCVLFMTDTYIHANIHMYMHKLSMLQIQNLVKVTIARRISNCMFIYMYVYISHLSFI